MQWLFNSYNLIAKLINLLQFWCFIHFSKFFKILFQSKIIVLLIYSNHVIKKENIYIYFIRITYL